MSEEQNISVKSDSYSVKTTTDITERIQELTKKTGLNHKDLFAAIVTRYYTELEAGSELDRNDDMQQIRYHLNRAENIFLGSLQKVQDLKTDYNVRLDALKTQHKEKEDELYQKIKNLTQELAKLATAHTETENQLKKVAARNQELEETHKGSRMTIELLSQKTEELKLQMGKINPLEAEIKELKEKIITKQENLTSLSSEMETAQQTIVKLNQLQNELAETARQQEENLNETHNKDVQQLKEVHQLEIDKALLESERRILVMIQKVKAEYQVKIDDLNLKNENLRSTNQNLTEKVYALEMDKLRQEQTLRE